MDVGYGDFAKFLERLTGAVVIECCMWCLIQPKIKLAGILREGVPHCYALLCKCAVSERING
jgi:hypothetical protein